MGTRLLTVSVAAALTALTACDTMGGFGAVSTTVQVAPNYRENDYSNAGGGRDMWVIAQGSVPGSDTAALQQRTIAAMQQSAGIKTRFTTQPQNYLPEYKTVLLFNGQPTVRSSELCANPGAYSAAGPMSASEVRVHAVFCRYDKFLTEVFGSARGGNSLSNPNFDALIRQTMIGLYNAPRDDSRQQPGDM